MRLLPPVLVLAALVLAPVAIAIPAEAAIEDVAVSRRTADRLGLKVGDVIEVSPEPSMAGSRRARVAVIWDAREHPADVARGELQIRFHLPALESLLSRSDEVDRVVVRLRDASQAARVRDDLNALGVGVDAYTADELTRHTSRTFVVVSRFHRAIGLIAVLASGIFLVTIMTLKLAEMRREIGALRLLGIGRQTIGLTVVAVAGAAAVVGSVIGVGLGVVLVWGINAYYRPLFETSLRFAVIVPQTVVLACGLAIAAGLGAGAVVAVRLLRRRPLEQVGR